MLFWSFSSSLVKIILGVLWDGEYVTECNGGLGKCTVKQSYTYLIMGHFDYDGSGYLCKHATTKYPWLHG